MKQQRTFRAVWPSAALMEQEVAEGSEESLPFCLLDRELN